MSDIVSLNNYRQDFQEDSPLFFPVKAIENYEIIDDAGRSFHNPNGVAIVREDTNEVIGTHKSGFKLVKNSEVFPAVHDALKRSSLDLTGMTIKDEISNGGAKAFRTYVFPAHTVEISNGDECQLQIRWGNSYDGSMSLNAIGGAFRLLCSNGMVAGDVAGRVKRKHTKNIDFESLVASINNSTVEYIRRMEEWKNWTTVHVTDAAAQTVFEAMPGTNDKLVEKLMRNWQDEKSEIGNTKWALFNALTYWSTHEDVRESRKDNVASIVAQRESRVAKVMESHAFQRLAA